MSETPPPSAAVTTMTTDKPTNMPTDEPPTQSTAVEQPTAMPAQVDPRAQEFAPGCDLAIFSTELCTQAKRAGEGQLRQPVIVRSDGVKGVVDAARNWQHRFKVQCLCIFPNQGWTVSDLWDAVDVQLDTPSFCREMLTFISRETYHVACTFAKDWICAHPNRLSVVECDMAELHDTDDPFCMVDKIFTEGERGAFPRTFLWHVAHMMRATVLEMGLANAAVANHDKDTACASQRKDVNTAPRAVSDTTQATLSQAIKVAASTSRKGNRKITRSRSNKLTDLPESSTSIEPSSVKSAPLPTTAPPSEQAHEQTRVLSQEIQRPRKQQAGPVGILVHGSTGYNMASPNIPPLTLKVPKGPPRNTGTAAYSQSSQSHGWAENNYRPGSGQYPPQYTSNGMPQLTSPHFMAPNMAMGHHVVPAGYASPYVHGPPMVEANMAPMPHYNPAIVQPGIMLHPSNMVPSPHMAPVYIPQPHTVRGVSMGDMTNNGYYTNSTAPHTVNHQTSSVRGPSNYSANGTLFDPYNGANSSFRETTAYNKGKKPHYNDTTYQADRPRNISNTWSRSPHAAYKPERATNQPYNGVPYNHHPRPRQYCEDDPNITENHVTGCHEQWIGPENVTVNEIFVGDLPVDVMLGEVQKMFEQQMSIVPANISVRNPRRTEGFVQHDRCHAFVALQSTDDAKKVMNMRERSFRLRDDGYPVKVSVPRRFYQLPTEPLQRGPSGSGSYLVPTQPEDRGGQMAIRVSTRDEDKMVEPFGVGASRVKVVYSPQDARSSLRKKSDPKPNTNDAVPDEVSQVQKPDPQQVSPANKKQTKGESATSKTPSGQGTKVANPTTKGPATVATVASKDKSTQHVAPNKKKYLLVVSALQSEAGEASPGLDESGSRTTNQLDSGPIANFLSEPTVDSDTVGQPTELKSREEKQSNQAAVVSRPQSTERNVMIQDAPYKNSGTALNTQPQPKAAVSDQKFSEMPTAAHQAEEEFTKDVAKAAPSAGFTQPTSAMKPSLATSRAEDIEAGVLHDETALGIKTESVIKSATNLILNAPAKPGVQQISSLHPYAKPNKVQQKKAKEVLRKQQKKEQAEKAEKLKAEKAKAEKARAEKSKIATKAKDAVVPEDGIEKLQDSGLMPVQPDDSGKSVSDIPATSEVEKTNTTKVDNGELTAKANGTSVANTDVQESEPIIGPAMSSVQSALPVHAKTALSVLKDVNKPDYEANQIATMSTERSKVKPKVEDPPASPVSPVPADDSTKSVSAEPKTPTPKKKLKSKRKKTKAARTNDENEQVERTATGKLHSLNVECNSITPKSIIAKAIPTQLVLLSGSAAVLATEVRSSNSTTLPSIGVADPQLRPSSEQENANADKDWPILAAPQQNIPHSEQLDSRPIVRRPAHVPPSYPFVSESHTPVINTPPSENDCDISLSLLPLDEIATAERQTASSASIHTPNSDILQHDVTEMAAPVLDTFVVETPSSKKRKNKKKNKKKSTTDATDSPAPASANKIELHVTASRPSSSSDKTGTRVFSYKKPTSTASTASGIQDPLLAMAAAAVREQKNDGIRQAIGGKVHYLVTTTKGASLADVQAEYAAAGAQPRSESYELSEGETVEDLLPKKLLSKDLQEYLRDIPSQVKDPDKKKS